MKRPAGIQTQLVVSLALVMALAVGVMAALLFSHHDAQLRGLLGRALVQEAREPRAIGETLVPGASWWTVHPGGAATPRSPAAGAIDPPTLRLASQVGEQGGALLQPGPFWGEIRFATLVDGTVVASRIPKSLSLELRGTGIGIAALLLIGDVLIFTLLGAYLVRERISAPLARLASAARRMAAGEGQTRVAVEGARETSELGAAWNEMSEALEERTSATEKALRELREANAELRRARAGLDRAERLASVGRLAAGVAHEVGNPIGAMLALVDLASRDAGLSDASKGHLDRVAGEGERVRKILRQLLDFSRPSKPTPSAVDLALLAEETVSLLSAQRKFASIEVEVERSTGAPPAYADPGSVTQILVNLLLNAADALSDESSPRIVLRIEPWVRETRPEEGPEEALVGGRHPDSVRCLVRDNGSGIPEEDRERLFDPFFTTKSPGEGTGLGLANAARLAEDLEGRLEVVACDPPWVTGFALVLPVPEKRSASAAAHSSADCEEDCAAMPPRAIRNSRGALE